ncbi:SDR family NAD(P)-dependent oxidoreductase [Tenggerimyces flavus]|uniref:SDR family NAD(P)-dependent oxidoreductase n=1 Tax=Tenggerimyces flavus TaxID=1708749 RepID=A0ABV7YE98_9ACTN|nr:SDR family oxidoreductase [Tenggerimyces flavus]MBM7788011.1 glucose 1-dehydrogenase [Tenggerimyces flavus]
MTVAVVTGGAGGIGSACARALAEAGHAVAVVDRAAESVERVVTSLRSDGHTALGIVADATSGIAVALAEIRSALGPVSVAVSAVAHEEHAPTLSLQPEQLERALSGTVKGALTYWQLAAQQMIEAGQGGRIVVVSSLHATLPFTGAAGYNAAQGALRAMALTFARDLIPHRVTVNLVEPGWIDTPGEREFYIDEELRLAGERHPWGRLGLPEDIAAAVAYLASPGAAYVTGATLRVDGGMSLAMTELPRGDG